MPRPRRMRWVSFQPHITYFKPAGVRIVDLDEVILTIDELEAVRLKDVEDLDQVACADKMNISQSTFHRLLSSARKKIADSLVTGKAIRIEGGDFKMTPRGARRGRGFGRGAGGPPGECICPNCQHREPHQIGVPCYTRKCPKCGAPLTRA